MTTRERAPTVREADLKTMRNIVRLYLSEGQGWEDIYLNLETVLPPSISREDVRRFVIPRLAK